ncbi:MAG TPA: LuxR C-terminal-related transcriptional regulator [Chloroflexota bacterium]
MVVPGVAVPGGLPSQPTALIGREREVAHLRRLLLSPELRLLTLVGTGGTGKTRLALAVAADLVDAFEHGVIFVDLCAAPSPADVVPTIARALGLVDLGTHVPLDRLRQYLATRHLLLMLDNFEHVLGAAAQIADLLAACPSLKILVTSRAGLRLRWEHEFPVQPLSLPPTARTQSADAIADVPAVALFVQRAQSVRPGFALTDQNAPAVDAICRRLDGLPLAIELAAVRTKLFPPQALLPRLDHRLAVLTDGPREVPARQQTLRNAIAWSYDLLTPTEQSLFRHLSVFAGGCTVWAAEAVSGPIDGSNVLDAIGSLIDKSLLRMHETTDGGVRFVMLETLREFAAEQLHLDPDADDVRRRHAHAFLALAEEAKPHLAGPAREAWLGRLEADYENLRVALQWLLEQHDGQHACRLASALDWFWYFQGHVGDGRNSLERALEAGDVCATSIERASALATLGHMAWLQGDHEVARRSLEEALSLSRGLGDQHIRADALIHLAFVLDDGNPTRRAELEQEGLEISRELGDPWWTALALLGSGIRAVGRGDQALARPRLEESLGLWEQLGDRRFIAQALNALADVARTEADYDRAADLYSRSLASLQHQANAEGTASVLHNLGYIAHHQNDDRRALGLFSQALDVFGDQGDRRGVAECLAGIGAAILGLGRARQAVHLFAASEGLLASIGSAPWPANLVDIQQARALARTQLHEQAWTQAWEEGRGMATERGIEYARELAHELLVIGERSTPPVHARLRGNPLTSREREIALLLARGYSNRQLAETLVITEQTAETHVKHILGKLELRSRHQVAEWVSHTDLAG